MSDTTTIDMKVIITELEDGGMLATVVHNRNGDEWVECVFNGWVTEDASVTRMIYRSQGEICNAVGRFVDEELTFRADYDTTSTYKGGNQ